MPNLYERSVNLKAVSRVSSGATGKRPSVRNRAIATTSALLCPVKSKILLQPFDYHAPCLRPNHQMTPRVAVSWFLEKTFCALVRKIA